MSVRILGALLPMIALLAAPLHGQTTRRSNDRDLRYPLLTLSVTPAGVDGRSHGGKSLWTPLSAGETTEAALRVGEAGGDPCLFQRRDGNKSAFTWTVTQALVRAGTESAVVDVTLRRTNDPSFGPGLERRRTYDLRENDPLVVDYVVLPDAVGARRQCETLTVKLELSFVEDPSVSNALLGYDLWLVHDDRAGRHTEQQMTTARQGKDADFVFSPRVYEVGGVRAEVTVMGQVKGRARPDGRIDLSIQPLRAVSFGPSATSNGGSKQVTVAPGETVEVELPPPPADGPGMLPPAVRALLSAQRTALRITAKRIR